MDLHITCFGPFPGVPVNPTSVVMASITERLQSCPTVTVQSTTQLEVTPTAVDAYVAAQPPPRDHGRPTLYLHLGVHVGSDSVRVETAAVNDLHCPRGDASGRVTDHAHIDDLSPASSAPGTPRTDDDAAAYDDCGFGGPSTVRRSALRPLLPLTDPPVSPEAAFARTSSLLESSIEAAKARAVEESHQCPLALSTNAGRYLCNYTLRRSLQCLSSSHLRVPRQPSGPASAATKGPICVRGPTSGTASLFVHVPDRNDAGGSIVHGALIAEFLIALSSKLL